MTRPAPSSKPLAQKLGVKPNQTLRVFHAPEHILGMLEPMPAGARLELAQDGVFDVVLAFAADQAALREAAADAIPASDSGKTALWIAFPKGSSKLQTDITRDRGWDPVWDRGLEGVSLVSVDDTWSAMRFRPATGDPHRRAAS
ncbi:MAG: hypothetical protein ACM3S1_06755 [Hyphomicrobiales bacterium]